MVLPIVASIAMFGASAQAVIAPTVVASILCVVLVAILGRMIWGTREGIIAGFLLSFLPSFRLYSSSAYPDVHACLWATLAVILAVASTRAQRRGGTWVLAIVCGLCVGLATSAKIFAFTVIVSVCGIHFFQRKQPSSQRIACLSAVAAGFGVFSLIEGLFYSYAANDFLFRYHTLSAVQSADELFAATSGTAKEFLKEAWHRVSMPLEPNRSTWGLVALAFWPAAILAFLKSTRGRIIAFWAVAAYLLIALAPVRFRNGPQIFPFFSGRTALTTCVPFALCTAWMIMQALRIFVPVAMHALAQPVVLATLVLASFALPSALEGIRHSHTKMVGLAIKRAISETDWSQAGEIFVHPATYIRFGVLFPPQLRARLRVAVDESSATWWHQSAWDINERVRALPPPRGAFLLATPAQLRGEAELWDYDVILPREPLKLWAEATPLNELALCGDARVDALSSCDSSPATPLICVVAGTHPRRVATAKSS